MTSQKKIESAINEIRVTVDEETAVKCGDCGFSSQTMSWIGPCPRCGGPRLGGAPAAEPRAQKHITDGECIRLHQLKWTEGLSVDEIAARTNRHRQTIQKHLRGECSHE